jgi:ParB family chromosome partitioning protein
MATEQVVFIHVNQIVPGDNDRKEFNKAGIEELAGDIARAGKLINPITVRPMPDGTYQIVAGERRWRAHQLLGWSTIAAFVRELSDEETDLIMLSENVQRVDLNAIEQAYGFQKQLDKYNRTPQEIAQVCSVSVDLVRRRLGLLELIPDIKGMIASGNLKVGHAECLIGLDANNQIAAVKQLNERHIDQRGFRQICNELLEKQQQNTMFDLDSLFVELRDEYEREKESRKRHDSKALLSEIETLKAELAAERERSETLKAELAAERERSETLKAELAAKREKPAVIRKHQPQMRHQPAQQTSFLDIWGYQAEINTQKENRYAYPIRESHRKGRSAIRQERSRAVYQQEQSHTPHRAGAIPLCA